MADSVTIDLEGESDYTKGYGEEFDISQSTRIDVTGNIGGTELEDDGDFDEKADLLKAPEEDKPDGAKTAWLCFSVFSVENYQKYFRVTTGDVLSRVFWGTVPRRTPLNDVIKSNPDLYGPFWVCMTLVVVLSVALHMVKAVKSDGWSFDFSTIVVVFSIIYVYAWIIAFLIWGFFWWRIGENSYSLLQTICMYGYSMSGYNLALVLAVIPLEWAKWLLIMVIGALTGLVLIYPFWDLLKKRKDKKMAFILAFLFIMHLAVGVAIKFLCLSETMPWRWGSGAPTNSTTAPVHTEATTVYHNDTLNVIPMTKI